jgi:2-methylcitrate dehydratase
MVVVEDERYTREYLEADKRSIANAIQIHYKDGSESEFVEVEYPIGHRFRREEGIPVLEKKFENSLAKKFDQAAQDKIMSVCLDQDKLEQMSAVDFMNMFVVK